MNWGVWKSFGLTSTSSVTGLRELRSQTYSLCSASEEGKQFSFPSPDFDDAQSPGWKIVNC